MTLIARPLGSSCPIIFSDILMTDVEVEESHVLPTIGFDITNHLSKLNDRLPAGLNQKIYILRENICVAFSGWECEIVELLKELRSFLRKFDCAGEKEIRYFFEHHYDIKGN